MRQARYSAAFLLILFLAWGCARPHGDGAGKEGIILTAFGTSVPEARAAYGEIEREYREAFPGAELEWAFTSQKIRKKLAAEGLETSGVDGALDKLAKEGVSVVRVQSLHVMAGEEFAKLARAIVYYAHENPGRFKAVYLGRPLLESARDGQTVARALSESLAGNGAEAVILMGHGQKKGRAGLVMEGAGAALKNEDPRFFLASVEGEKGFPELLQELRKRKIKTAFLAPLMLVAGDHARNDLAGDEEDSWKSRLEKAGIKALGASMEGLGGKKEIRDLFIRHTREADENLALPPGSRRGDQEG